MKGGPTDPPNVNSENDEAPPLPASMKGGPTDPPNFNEVVLLGPRQFGLQ